ncbi:MAG: hypothetical protein QXJ06_05595 [Candidatus Aenigmatarchaeota archaeon]
MVLFQAIVYNGKPLLYVGNNFSQLLILYPYSRAQKILNIGRRRSRIDIYYRGFNNGKPDVIYKILE